ncbi:hypothetical protein DID77_04195 [Candidatus Marinamargulisbacteria bacterium SCGC AG-439-L15]|nr:hypothetical protein DID77_04195 [Candidatus Marinamargulisbacteria bacterium SCGC AG-439-L15]
MTKKPSSKVALITGASSGIGYELTKLFAENGYNVCFSARRLEKLSKLSETLRQTGSQVLPIQCDCKDKQEVQTMVQHCLKQFGHIDIAIANAGCSETNPGTQFSSQAVENTFQTNVMGVAYLYEAIIPHMIKRQTGHLVSIASLASYRGMPESGTYCASKSALVTLTEGLRLDLKKSGITVSTINPGFIKSEITDKNTFPMPFLLETKRGAQHIYNAIQKKKTLYEFPWPLVFIMKLIRQLPICLFDPLFSKVKSPKKSQ